MVTSNHPNSSELTSLGKIIAVYGKGADAYGKLKVSKVSEFLTNEKLILSTEYAKSIGTLQLTKSPYAQNRAMLVLNSKIEALVYIKSKK